MQLMIIYLCLELLPQMKAQQHSNKYKKIISHCPLIAKTVLDILTPQMYRMLFDSLSCPFMDRLNERQILSISLLDLLLIEI